MSLNAGSQGCARVKSPAGTQVLFPDSNDLPPCGFPRALAEAALDISTRLIPGQSLGSQLQECGISRPHCGHRSGHLAGAWLPRADAGTWGAQPCQGACGARACSPEGSAGPASPLMTLSRAHPPHPVRRVVSHHQCWLSQGHPERRGGAPGVGNGTTPGSSGWPPTAPLFAPTFAAPGGPTPYPGGSDPPPAFARLSRDGQLTI